MGPNVTVNYGLFLAVNNGLTCNMGECAAKYINIMLFSFPKCLFSILITCIYA